MGSLVLTGDTSGSVTVAVPAVAGSNTATIGAATGTHYPFTAGTAVASTSGTSIDFTNIPSWVKRVTVMFSTVSNTGTGNMLVQIGTGSSPTTSGYFSIGAFNGSTSNGSTSSTAGFIINTDNASDEFSGAMTISLVNPSTNTWVASYAMARKQGTFYYSATGGGTVALAGTLGMVRLTTPAGSATFDAGSINILYE